MAVSIPVAVGHVIEEYRRFLRTTFRFRDPKLKEQFERYLGQAGVVVRGPYVTLSRDFERGPTLKDLVEKHGAAPEMLRLNWTFGDGALYRHQADAFEAGRAGRPFIVTTGTGSGKTEAFLLPIIDSILRRKREGIRGVQAVLLYPMNALANDQLDRMRALIRGSGVNVSYGLYTGESDKVVTESKEPPAETERMSHEAIRKDPPDILLTNYKQLEFLLIRKEDRFLFTEALRFLVLDEVHSYKGALATEIACLIRRIKAHARLAQGRLVGIGTSATVASGAGGAKAMAEFASRLFGETFRPEEIIEERLVPATPAGDEWTPPAPRLDAKDLDARDPEAVSKLAERLSGRPSKEALAGNSFARALETIFAKPTSILDAAKAICERFPDRKDPVAAVHEIEAYLIVGSTGDDGSPPRLRPKLHTFFHGVYDVWLCLNPECRALVPQGGTECRMCKKVARPAALCRTCGQDFVKVKFDQDDEDGAPSGTGDFFSDRSTGFLTLKLLGTPDEGDEGDNGKKKGKSKKDKLVPVDVCLDCGRVMDAGTVCGKCEKPGTRYLLYRWTQKKDPGRGILHSCPACGGIYTRGDIVTPLRSGTASTVAVLMERHLDLLDPEDRRLLVFADNRQDTAHQAGYSEDKHRSFALRHVVGYVVSDAGERGAYLDELADHLFEHYQRLGIITGRPTRPEREKLREVLKFEAANEFTRHVRQRMSLENLGLVSVEYEFLEDLPKESGFLELLKDFSLDLGKGLNLVRAILDVMRLKRAVAYPFFQDYTDPERKAKYRAWEAYGARFPEFDLGPHGFAVGRPAAIRASRSNSIHGFYQENPRAGRKAAPQKLLERVAGPREDAEDFFKRLIPILEKVSLLESVPSFPIPKKDRVPGLRILQINPKVIRLLRARRLYRCTTCKAWCAYEFPGCPSPKCQDGKLSEALVEEDNYYVRLYTDVAPHPLRVAEHSAQISDEERARREAKFKNGQLNALVSTPTLELGVDIGQLHTVVLRNAPPAPANYVQRVGRAGRRYRIGFASTFCAGGAHDRHVFENPEWLVAGQFVPPRLRLDNVKIVHRHLRSFLLELLEAQVPVRLGDLLDNVVTPSRWEPERIEALLGEMEARKDELSGRIEELFVADRSAGVVARYGTEECGEVIGEFRERLLAVMDRWWKRVRQLDEEYKKYAKIGSPSHDIKKASARRRAYKELTEDPKSAYTLNYLGTQGFLPAYQFPLDTFSLDPGVSDTPTLHRAANIAIEEFAPGNYVYANGKKLKSIRVLFAGAPTGAPAAGGAESSGRLRQYFFCEKCDEVSPEVRNACSRCGGAMGTAVDCVFVDAFEAEENTTIDATEESRHRRYFVRKESVLSSGEETELYPYPLAPVELRRLARLLITNWGPSDSKTGEGQRFWLCQDCGRHQPHDPMNPAHRESLQRWQDDHRRLCSGEPLLLVLGYEFQTDCLVLSVAGPKDLGRSGQSLSPTLATLAEALLAGARSVLELETSELRAFPRASKEDDETGEIVFYETVPGGAGYLEEFARRLPEAARAARERLFGHDCGQACYLCLKHYWNQRIHRVLDKHLVRDTLGAIESMDNVEPVVEAAGSGPDRLREDLRRRREELQASGKLPGTGGPQSPIESRLLEALRRIPDLPPPVAQLPLPDAERPRTIPDFAFPDAKIVIFCDGFAFHGNRETLELDADKRNWLQSKEGGGWMVLTYWGRTINRDADGCAQEIAKAVRSRVRQGKRDGG